MFVSLPAEPWRLASDFKRTSTAIVIDELLILAAKVE
jgi:hypothetical protein